MRKISLIILFIVCRHASGAQPVQVPQEMKGFLKPGFEVMELVKTDLDADGRKDYLLVYKKAGEDTMSMENADMESNRPLVLVVRQPNGSLKVVAGNDAIILCKFCGGSMGDPYAGITTKPGLFTISFYGGSSWRWTDDYSFQYDKQKKNWYLQVHTNTSFQAGDPEKTFSETVIRRNETGDISVADFSPWYNADSSSWKVTAAKSFFYKSPDRLSKPGKAYLVKGDAVQSIKRFKNFIECSFKNSNGDITYGYILRNDLLLISEHSPHNLR